MKSPLLLSLSLLLSSTVLLALTPEQAQEQTELGRRYVLGEGVEQDYAKAIELLTPAAAAGNLLAKHSLGYMYTEGVGVPIDSAKGIALIAEAAEAGFARSQEALAAAYASGDDGLKLDREKSLYWLEKAMAQGETDTLTEMVNVYTVGNQTIPADIELANSLLLKAANMGMAEFQMELGYRYLIGKGMPVDTEQALMWTKRAAEQGDAGAMGNLAYMYMVGLPQLEQDYKKVYEWADKGAALGDRSSYNLKAACLLDGTGVEKDVQEGLRCMQKAAELGDVDALANLSTFYRLGEHGVQEDPEKAFQYAKAAAELGHADSMSAVAIFYMDGYGVEKDMEQCYEWTKKAAEAGHIDAMSNMTFLYREGVGVAANPSQAFAWAERAAATGDPRGICNLATVYLEGVGVAADAEKGIALLEQAADLGYLDAYGILINYFSQEEVKDVERVARYQEKANALFQKLQQAQQE